MTNDIDKLTALNRDFVASAQNSDVRRFDEILAPEFYCSNPDKSLVDRVAFLEQTAKPVAIKNLQAHDVKIRIMGDFAIIHAAFSYTTPDGQQAHGRYTDCWAKQNGKWPRYRRMRRDDAQPSLPGLTRQSIANKDFFAKMAKRQITEETIHMKAIVVTDQAAGTAGMTLVERPEPQAAINDVVVQVHASGFTSGELTWPSTWTDRLDRDRTPSIPGQELAGVVTALGYGTTGLSVGQRVFGLSDSYRGGTLAEYVAIEARNLAPLPRDVDFTVGASVAMPGLTAWQGLFEHGRLQAGQSVLVHGAAGAVASMVTQLARGFGVYVIGTGRAADRQKALDFGAQEFVDLDNDALEDVGGVDLVFDVIGGEIGKRSAGVIWPGGTLVTIAGPTETRPADGLAIDFVLVSDRAQLGEIVQRVRDGRLRTNIRSEEHTS